MYAAIYLVSPRKARKIIIAYQTELAACRQYAIAQGFTDSN